MLEARNARITLGQRKFDYSLQVVPGEIVVILGASGSGKSTLLNLVGGFLDPEEGEITWCGKSLLGLLPGERPVTTLFQKHNLFEHLPVWKNVALGFDPGARLDSTQKQQLVDTLSQVGLAGFEQRRPGDLSGGEQQRVALARCLVSQKPVLLLDEPYSALDGDRRAQMLALTRRIVDTARLCAVLVNHDPNDAIALGARVVRLLDGRLVAEGRSRPAV